MFCFTAFSDPVTNSFYSNTYLLVLSLTGIFYLKIMLFDPKSIMYRYVCQIIYVLEIHLNMSVIYLKELRVNRKLLKFAKLY